MGRDAPSGDPVGIAFPARLRSAIAPADDISMTSVPVATLFEAALGRLSDVLTPGSFLEATPESLVVAETGGEIDLRERRL